MQNKLILGASDSKLTLPIIGILALGFMTFNIGIIGGEHGGFFLMEKFPSLYPYQDYISLFSSGLVGIIVFFWAKYIEKRSITSLGLPRKNNFKSLIKGIFFGTGVFTIVYIFSYILGQIQIDPVKLSFRSVLGVVFIFLFWLIQAAGEEILFRGWMLQSISQKTNIWIGILLSSLLFVLVHYGNAGANFLSYANIFIFGVVFALVSLKYQNIWIAIGFHGSWNFVQSCIFGMSVSGTPPSTERLMTSLYSGGSFGIEGSMITSLVGIIICIYIFLNIEKRASKLL